MTILRNEDGTLVVPVRQERRHDEEEVAAEETTASTAETTRVLHPGEGGYDEALVEWDLQQNPDRKPAVSTPNGRQEAMTLVHAMAESPQHDVSAAMEAINDPEASGEALRHVLVGGVHSVEDFAVEVAESQGGEPLPAHTATKIIGEVLTELDS
jgi:signal transduction protein with GAF and PtsI domain